VILAARIINLQISRKFAASPPGRIQLRWVKIVLFLAVKSLGNFARELILFFPPRFECSGKDLLEMIAVVYGGMKKNNVGALFGSGSFVLQGWMTVGGSVADAFFICCNIQSRPR